MSGPTHRYEEASFAACLLHCGPHEPIGDNGLWIGDYYERVYKYFFELFPSYHDVPINVKLSGGHEWAVFWREYLEWVER